MTKFQKREESVVVVVEEFVFTRLVATYSRARSQNGAMVRPRSSSTVVSVCPLCFVVTVAKASSPDMYWRGRVLPEQLLNGQAARPAAAVRKTTRLRWTRWGGSRFEIK